MTALAVVQGVVLLAAPSAPLIALGVWWNSNTISHNFIDTAPTLIDLAGLGIPASYQGRSMLDGAAGMALFFADYSLGLLGLRDGSRKFVYELDSDRSRMFDVENDPQEKIDVSGREAERARSYVQSLREWSAAQKQLIDAGPAAASIPPAAPRRPSRHPPA